MTVGRTFRCARFLSCHCEEHCDEAISLRCVFESKDCFASRHAFASQLRLTAMTDNPTKSL